MWLFRLGRSDDDPTLAWAFVARSVRWLVRAADEFVPINGLNENYADLLDLVRSRVSDATARSSCPSTGLREQSAELIGTHQRPTCVGWMAA